MTNGPKPRSRWAKIVSAMMSILLPFLIIGTTPQTQVPNWFGSPHSVPLGNQKLDYQATAGIIPMTDDKGEIGANVFFAAYTVPQPSSRPITFVWNGGPGGASMLLHMFCMGPRALAQDPKDPKAFKITDNPNTLLPETDLVFMDPVGTGYSKPVKNDGKAYYGVDGDLKVTAQFIKKYLDQTGRSKAPVFIAGESYGTFRAAGVVRPLLNDGVDVKGLVLLSNAIRFDTFVGRNDDDLPYTVFLPTLTATAAFHKKLKPAWNAHPDQAIAASKAYASADYMVALAKGDSISKEDKRKAAQKLSELTSLPIDYIESKNLRIDSDEFRYRLFHGEGKHVGKFDGNEIDDINVASPAAVKVFTDYLRDEIGYKTDDKYVSINMGVNIRWDYGRALMGFPDQSDNLRSAMEKYPSLKLFVAQGIYDMTTPFYGEEYSFNHLGLSDKVKDHWEFHTYEGGHMMYLVPATHERLRSDILSFMQKCLKG